MCADIGIDQGRDEIVGVVADHDPGCAHDLHRPEDQIDRIVRGELPMLAGLRCQLIGVAAKATIRRNSEDDRICSLKYALRG